MRRTEAASPRRAPVRPAEAGRAAAEVSARLIHEFVADLESHRTRFSATLRDRKRQFHDRSIFVMNTFNIVVGAAFISAALAGPSLAQSSISDIEARLALQRQGAVSNGAAPAVRTRGIEEVLPSQLRRKADPAAAATSPSPKPVETAAARPAAAATPAAPRTESGATLAAARPAAPAATLAGTPRIIDTVDTDGRVIEVKVYSQADNVDISEPVRFEYNSAFLTDQGRGVLDVYCSAIKGSEAKNGPAPGGYVLIGHADASGDAAYNEVLSKKRAEESRRYMVESCGLPESRLRAVGLGEAALKDPSRPTAAVNRRVELQIGS